MSDARDALLSKLETIGPQSSLDAVYTFVAEDLLPALRAFASEAKAYADERDEFNQTIRPHVAKMDSKLHKMCDDLKMEYELHLMSSYPKLNLVRDSDVDYGLLIKDLTMDKTRTIHAHLIKKGFSYVGTCNPQSPNNSYHCYAKRVEADEAWIDLEIKVRDMDHSRVVVQIHQVQNEYPAELAALFTYAKYLLKEDKAIYGKLKVCIYGYATHQVKGGFLMVVEKKEKLEELTRDDE